MFATTQTLPTTIIIMAFDVFGAVVVVVLGANSNDCDHTNGAIFDNDASEGHKNHALLRAGNHTCVGMVAYFMLTNSGNQKLNEASYQNCLCAISI